MPARLTTAAMEWAAKAMSRAVGLTVRQQAFNPSAVDRSNVLLRVEPLCKWYDFNARSCGTFADLPRNTSAPRERLVRTVWLRDGVVERGVAGSDPRGVWLNRHTLLAIYSNWATFWRDDPKTKLPKHAFVVMAAQHLSDPSSKAVPLWLAGLRQAAWEKNWVPFRHGGRVLLSYQLTPQHMVLTCEWSCGRSTPKKSLRESSPRRELERELLVHLGVLSRLHLELDLVVHVVDHQRVEPPDAHHCEDRVRREEELVLAADGAVRAVDACRAGEGRLRARARGAGGR